MNHSKAGSLLWFAFLFASGASGCSGAESADRDAASIDRDTSASDTSAQADTASSSETSKTGSTDEGADSEETCGEESFNIAVQPVDILIVLDRSSSMTDQGLWAPMCQAITHLTSQTADDVNYGLMVFPDLDCSAGNQCIAPTDPRVSIGADNAALIASELSDQGVGTCVAGGTPTAATLQQALGVLQSVNDEHSRYVLLATDGAPNCNENLSCDDCTVVHPYSCGGPAHCLDDEQTTAAAADLAAAGFPVYVMGLGTVVKWQEVMNAVAAAGQTENYYRADDPAQFLAQLEEITAKVASCDFRVDWEDLPSYASADPAKVNLYCKEKADDPATPQNRIGYDDGCGAGAGWTWLDDNRLRLCDAACEALRGGACGAISATFGCESVPVVK